MNLMRLAIASAVVVALAATAWLTIQTKRNRLVLDRFDVVKARVLYRSGQLTIDQLDEVVRREGIRTIINFQLPGDPVEAEANLAKRHGIDFINLPMPGDGFGREDQFREVLKATDDPNRRPVLVHCARGTCRTGAAVALYRIERDGWTIEDVDAELRRHSYKEGWIAGYIFQMARNKLDIDIFEPRFRHDVNLAPPAPEAPPASPESLPILPPLRGSASTNPDAPLPPEIQPIAEVPHGN